MQLIEIDKFQPMSLIKALKGYLKDTSEKILTLKECEKEGEVIDTLHLASLQGVTMGLAWAIAEIESQATAKDRYTA